MSNCDIKQTELEYILALALTSAFRAFDCDAVMVQFKDTKAILIYDEGNTHLYCFDDWKEETAFTKEFENGIFLKFTEVH